MKDKCIIYLSIIFIAFNAYMVISVVTYTANSMNILLFLSNGQTKSMLFVALLVYGIFQIPWGVLSDRFGRKNILLITQVLLIIGLFACLFSSSYEFLMAGTVILCFSTSASAALARAPAVDCFKTHELIRHIKPTIATLGAKSLLDYTLLES